jgi:hypothetical protein
MVYAPTHEYRASRRYLRNTLIIETGFETETETAVVRDFMPLRDVPAMWSAWLRAKGNVSFDFELAVRFDTVPVQRCRPLVGGV